MSFQLHPQLAADTLPILGLPLCELLLMNNKLFPWVILVPRVEGAVELVDLDRAQRHQLMDEIAQVSEAAQHLFQPAKLNVAALGNVVPQLHIHLLARLTDDAAWPKPVWGHAPIEAYGPGGAEAQIEAWRAVLNQPHAAHA